MSRVIEKCGFVNYYKPKSHDNEKVGVIHIYAKQTVKDFLDWIYKDSTIHIDRKYDRYYSYYYENKPLKLYSNDKRYRYNKYINPKTGLIE